MKAWSDTEGLSAVLEASSDSALITDLAGRISWVNPVFTQRSGYSAEEVIGQNPRFLKSGIHAGLFFRDQWDTLLSGKVWQGEVTNRRKDGTVYVEHQRILPIINQEGVITHFVATGRAAQEPKAAGSGTHESTDQFRQLVENAPEGIFIHSDDRFRYLNPTALRLFGAASAEQLIGTPVMERVHPDWHSEVVQRMHLVGTSRRSVPLDEKKYLRLDGSEFDVEVSATPIIFEDQPSALAFFRDITERKRAEQAERRSSALLYSVVEGTTDVVYVKDLNSRFVLMNSAGCQATGKRAEEVLGRDDSTMVAPETALAGRERDRAIMANRATETREQDVVLGSGESRRVLVTEGPVLDDAGEVIGLFGISRDITERTRVEEEGLKLREQLQQAQKMESVGRLAGGVAHDFNNLLTVINGYGDLLQRNLSQDHPAYGSVAEILKAGERAAALTQQLLVMSRKQILRPRALNPNEVITDVANMLRRLIGADVRLVTTLSPAVGWVWADAGQLQQVLLNLAVNARDALPHGGEIVIETSNIELDESFTLKHSGVAAGSYVLISVSDNGTGMTEEVQRHLFEPFFTTKKQGQGTGLGLATVYGIVNQSGGSIWAYSEAGHGSIFKIYLPRTPAGKTTAARPQSPSPPQSGTETVLVVEDQAVIRKLVQVVLTGCGYQVLEAADATDALSQSNRHAGPIHLLLSDLVLPGLTGRELAKQLRPSRPDMKVLFMSGYSELVMLERGLLDAGDLYLPKPFSPDALAARVRQVLGPPRERATILIVDDEPGIRMFLRKVLSDAGYETVEAENGRIAMEQLKNANIDLVLLDLMMPEQEGLETIGILRKQSPNLKIVAMSGGFGIQFLRVAEVFGAQAKLAKPIRPDELLETVRSVLAARG